MTGRIVAIDYGKKRVGIAVTDCNRLIAHSLTTVSVQEIQPFLKQYTEAEEVCLFLVGKPKQLNNVDSDACKYVEPFVKRLQQAFPHIPIERMDERFTSKMAFQTLIDSGLGRQARQNKPLVDTVAATIMLQDYLKRLSIENERKEKQA
jgi:putative Holliday junction resolvase